MLTKQSLSLEAANRVLAAARDAANSIRPVSIAVVDDAGVLLAFARMDGARGYTADLAIQKARSSALVGVASSILAKAGVQTGGAGGEPVLHDGNCVGAVGVSGAKEEDDVSVARHAVRLLPTRTVNSDILPESD